MINLIYAYRFVYDEILKELEEMEKNGETELLPEKHYCEKYDVSLTTVRRALEQLYNEKIIIKIKGKGSFISDKVRKLRCEDNRFIGVLMVPFNDVQNRGYESKYKYKNPYAQKIYKTIFCELGSDYDLLIDTIDNNELENKFPSSVLDKAEKILIIGETKKSTIDFLHKRGKCVVVYNYYEKGISVARVNNDEREKYKQMTEYFIGLGYKKIACITGVNFHSEALERYMGFQDAMVVNDIYMDNNFIKWGDMTPESGYYLTKELMALPETPEVIICVNDGVAMGAYDAIKECGLRPGEDVLLAGHDNCETDKLDIVTIDPDYLGVGKKLAELLKRDTWIDDEFIHYGKLITK